MLSEMLDDDLDLLRDVVTVWAPRRVPVSRMFPVTSVDITAWYRYLLRFLLMVRGLVLVVSHRQVVVATEILCQGAELGQHQFCRSYLDMLPSQCIQQSATDHRKSLCEFLEQRWPPPPQNIWREVLLLLMNMQQCSASSMHHSKQSSVTVKYNQ